ncbi:metal ABC transporter permease [Oceanospirillum sediminis]|uniref:Metal ABC transporter permease n=1 Tax=Oceanospirillum sediminis TaxID=2760088 RepID=A0A839ILQ2_9GAMM|nr:metal ABC transporter permease [Oceanospirillum sediminis]MBB1486333.1 metal ABC transporter permease [Oceanospirillum sediminis]
MIDSLHQFITTLVTQGMLPEMFQYPFVTYALIAALLTGPLLGALGTLVVVKRLAFFSEAVGHGALTGIAIGILLGEPATQPVAALFSFCLCFALLLHWVKSRTQVPYDALVGVFLAFAIALGAALLLYVAKKVNVHILENVLFGSILTVTPVDLLILAIISAISLLLALRFANQALMASLQPDLARVQGVGGEKARVTLFDYAFILLIALVTVAAVKIIGAVLVGALLLIPATTARLISRNIRQFFIRTLLISTGCCVAGVVLPMAFELPVPSGAAIVLLASTLFLSTVLLNQLKILRIA